MVDNEDGGVPLVFMLSCITIVVILSCITFVAERQKIINREANEFYSKSITQEQVDESFKKFQQREAIRKSSTKEKRDKQTGD